MRGKKSSQNFILFFLFLSIILSINPTSHVYGSTLKYYNYNTNSNVNYSGQQVKYIFNSRDLNLPYPGIIIDGTALADFEDLFINELGLTGSVNGDTITISNNTTKIILTIGSKTASINGVKKTMNVAPVKLRFSNSSDKIYIPTRFVTEALGYSYVWLSSSSTVKITKTLHLSIDSKDVAYNGTLYTANCINKTLDASTIPMIYYNGSVYANAKLVFEAAGCHYEETSKTLLISKGNITIRTEIGTKDAYVNDIKFIMDLPPVQIMNKETNCTYLYIPIEFVSEMLGFQLTYNDTNKQFTLSETDCTGNMEKIPALSAYLLPPPESNTQNTVPSVPQPITYYFDWVADDSLSVPETSVYKKLTKMTAYAVDNADVVELYGINSDDIDVFTDNGLLIFDIDDTISYMENQYYFEATNPHLNYALLSGLTDSTVLYFIIQQDDAWYMIDQENYVQVYLIKEDLSFEDLFTTSETNIAPEKPLFPDNRIIIPLPDGYTLEQISDQDNYLDNNFQLLIPGNHTTFYKDNLIRNPYYTVKNYTIDYDTSSNNTIITFYTKSICAYEYSLEQNYLSVRVDRPGEIYSNVIVLDAGHGGIDPGAVKSGYYEKTLNFKILNTYVKELFNNSDVKVYFTRETDTLIDLYERAAFSSEVGADLFISLHMNSNNSSTVNGTEVYYSTDNNILTASGLNSYKLAKTLAENISTAIGTKNRGVTSSNFVVTKYNTVPAVLIELGFMTNSNELAKLTDPAYQKKTANAIYQTVLQIFEEYPQE